jgi:hypothetical protein
MPTITIALNGTNENPFHKLGLTQNPFPQMARYETDRQMLRLQALGGDPIPNAAHIRSWLEGYCSDELIELCVAQFRLGQMVKFAVSWREA